jgi:hypothetical protein
LPRLTRLSGGVEVRRIYAVVYHLDSPGTERVSEKRRVRVTHRYRTVDTRDGFSLETPVPMPLALDIPPLERVWFDFEVTLPDQRFYVVCDDEFARGRKPAEGRRIGGPFTVP